VGYPTCQQWWSDGTTGLSARLLAQVDSRSAHAPGEMGWVPHPGTSQRLGDPGDCRANSADHEPRAGLYGLRRPRSIGLFPTNVNRATSDVGARVGSLVFYPAMDAVRQALPIVLSF